MIHAHLDSCPALCNYMTCSRRQHEHHTCACTAKAQLEELVEAAKSALDAEDLAFTVHDRLDAALKPFTKENQ